MSQRPAITVFAGSSTPTDARILAGAKAFGAELAKSGYDLIYGGGMMGVMGAVAQAAADNGAAVTAVIVSKYAGEEQLPHATCLYVETEAERFEGLSADKRIVAFAMLPGGPGSSREALQAVELAVYDSGPPLILAHVADYLEGIRHYFSRAVDVGLIKETKSDKLRNWYEGDSLKAILENQLPLQNARASSFPPPFSTE